ncbi:MAG: PepSY-associated TM helix domain-containing protein [Proteobacteria bacterium]|nr:PepSY-associated TM helix domain-containing protein [Pseudomonadota bacterium]
MRALWVNLHLYAAAFLAPMLLLVSISGGLYLVGIKGSVVQTEVTVPAQARIDTDAPDLKQEVDGLLQASGVVHVFEYVKVSGSELTTRPTSRTYYEINVANDQITVTRNEPDLQKSMIELHKGHGPLWFKDFQKVLAVGLLFIVVSGLWLGIQSAQLRKRTLGTAASGLALFIVLVFLT